MQRGDAEVSQKLWRVVRACVELGEANPIEQIHDQVGQTRLGALCGIHVVHEVMSAERKCAARPKVCHPQASSVAELTHPPFLIAH